MVIPNDYFDQPILQISELDFLTPRVLAEGTFITGAPGSGKSTTSCRQLAYALLRLPSSGGLILTAKSEETANWIQYAKYCNRSDDLIVFSAASGLRFDPLHYEWTRPGRGAGDLESIIDLFSTLLSVGKTQTSQSHDPFGNVGRNR